jgi:hypothetical protein
VEERDNDEAPGREDDEPGAAPPGEQAPEELAASDAAAGDEAAAPEDAAGDAATETDADTDEMKPAASGESAPERAPLQESHEPEVSAMAEIYLGDSILVGRVRALSLADAHVVCDRMIPEGTFVGVHLYMAIDGIEDALAPPVQFRGMVDTCVREKDGVFVADVDFEEMDPERLRLVERFRRSLPGAASGDAR